MDIVLQQVAVGIALGSLYALIALGYNVVFATVGAFNFAQGHLVTLGSLLIVVFRVDHGWPLLPAFVACVLLVGLASIIMAKAISGPMGPDIPPSAWTLATLLGAVILGTFIQVGSGDEPRRVPSIWAAEPFRVGGSTIARDDVLLTVAAIGLTLTVALVLRRTTWGSAARAIRTGPWVPRLLGIPVPLILVAAFGVAGVIAAITGSLAGLSFGEVSPVGAMRLGLFGFVAVVIGGAGSPWGGLAGGMTVGMLETMGRGYLPPGIATASIFLVLIGILVVRPSGLFGGEQARRTIERAVRA